MTSASRAVYATDRRRELAAIHAAAASLGMDTADKSPDSVYRTVLRTQAGVSSAADLDAEGRRKVRAYLQRQLRNAQPGQAGKIDSLWRRLGTAGALRDPTPAGLQALCRAHAGEIVMVPKAAQALRAMRDRTIRAERDSHSVRQLALAHKLTRRRVQQIMADGCGQLDADQVDLFV